MSNYEKHRQAGLAASHTKGKAVERRAGHRASATKGKEEEIRAARAARWTIERGKDDAQNPWSRQNYSGSPEWRTQYRDGSAG